LPASLDVETLVRRVCGRLRDRAEAAEIRLVVVCAGGGMRGDAALLEETLFNLVGHAIETAAPRRAVHLETRVTDAGHQIWTIKGSSTELHREVMLSASVAMSLGGSLSFESRKGEGTTVRMWLPREGRSERTPVGRSIIGVPA
jgi:signal transduction histidine kinase